MVKNLQTPLQIDKVVNELYTRYILTRDITGYYYTVDSLYQGNLDSSGNVVSASNNVNYVGNDIIINLYQIQAK